MIGVPGGSGVAAVLSVNVMARGIAKTNTELATVQGNLEKTAAKGSAMGSMLSKGAKLGGAAVGTALVYGVTKAISVGSKFEKQMDTLGAVTETTGRQMSKLEKQALDLGESTQFTANQVAEAQTELAKGGLNVEQIYGGGVKASLSLAAAGDLELAEAAETTVNAMKLFHLEGKQAGQVADMMATAANKTTADVTDFAMALRQGGSAAKLAGEGIDTTITILEALAEAGIKNSDAGTSMKAALIQLLKPSVKQAKVARELGIEWTTQAGTMKNAVGLSRELQIATDGMTKAERAKTLATLAGTDGFRTLGALYDAGPAKLKRLEEANLKNGTAQDIARQKMNNLTGDAEQLTGALETSGIKLEHVLAPGLRAATQAVTKGIQEINGLDLEHLQHDLGISNKDLRETGQAARDVGQFWQRYFLPVVKEGIQGAIQALRGFAQIVKGVVQVVSGVLTGDFGQAWRGVKNIFGGSTTFILGNLKAATAPFKGAAVAIGGALSSAFADAWDGIKGIFTTGANAVIDVVNTIIDVINVIPGVPDIGKVGHVGGSKADTRLHYQHRATGGFIVPGTGSGDTFRTALPAGSFVENREAARAQAFAKGGELMPVALEPGERVYLPPEVRRIGSANLEARNRAIPRFQEGGMVQRFGIGGVVEDAVNTVSPVAGRVAGSVADAVAGAVGKGASYFIGKLPKPNIPEPFSGVGGYLISKVSEYIKNGFDEGKLGNLSVAPGARGPKGVGTYKGVPMANWVIQALQYASAAGVNAQPTSGYRPPDQVVTGPVVAPQGHSEHQGTQYPHGAVDFGGPYDLAAKVVKDAVVAATRSFKYPLLAPIGFHDDGHASGTGHMLGGLIRALSTGGPVPTSSGELVGASYYGGPTDHVSGTVGAAGVSLPGTMSFAELAMGKALGGLPFHTKLKVGYNGKSVIAEKLDIGLGGGDVNGHNRAIDLWYETANAIGMPGTGVVKVSPAGGGVAGLTAGQKQAREGKARKANYEHRLHALMGEVNQAQTAPAKQSKLWKLIKFWGRVGMFDQGEHAHIIEAVQNAAAQTKPQGAVDILQNLAAYAKDHGEITGQDPSNFRDMTKAIERAQDRGKKQREKAVERQKKHIEAIHGRVASKIAKRAAFPGLVANLAGMRRGADEQEELASQFVTLEPEDLSDAYVGQERGAYQGELDRLLNWRNSVIGAQGFATQEIARFQQQLAEIEAMAPQANVKGSKKGEGLASAQALSDKKTYEKVAYKIPLLKKAIEDATTMRDETWAGELEELQGLHGPAGVLSSLSPTPVAGYIGGRIFETQDAIAGLGLKLGSATGSGSEATSMLEELLRQANQRTAVSEAQKVTLENWDSMRKGFAGMFATGGSIPAGMWGIAGENGPEPVAGPGTVFSNREGREMFGGGGGNAPQVIINGDIVQEKGDTRDPIEVLEGDHRFPLLVQKHARAGKGVGLSTPGGAR